jgi:Uma2 family endonuclease
VARSPQQRRATYEDVVSAPPHLVAEIIDGDLLLSPRPSPRHANAKASLGAAIKGPFDWGTDGPGGWVILVEPELHFASTGEREVLVPDLAGWRRERLPRPPEQSAIEVPPDWVCEVISPSTETIDRVKKTRVYARERVGHLWLVNPVTTTLEVYRLVGENWQLIATHGGDGEVRAEPFEAVPLRLERLWRW